MKTRSLLDVRGALAVMQRAFYGFKSGPLLDADGGETTQTSAWDKDR